MTFKFMLLILSHSDLTLIPPPKTPEQENLIDFTVTTNTPPPGFSDDEKTPSSERAPHDVSTDSDTSLPQSAADLPSPIRTRLDELVRHDQDLSHQLLTMDALMLGKIHSHGGGGGIDEKVREYSWKFMKNCQSQRKVRKKWKCFVIVLENVDIAHFIFIFWEIGVRGTISSQGKFRT